MIVETFSYQHAYSIQHFYLIFKKFPSNMLIPSNTLNRKSRVPEATLYSDCVSMGSMGSVEPMDFESLVPEPMDFEGGFHKI